MPVYLTTDPEDFPLELGLPAAGPPLLPPCELQRRKMPSVDTMQQMFQAFDDHKVDIKGFQWFGVRFLGEVNGDAPVHWESYFPHRVNNMHISYLFHNNHIETRGSLRRLKTATDAEDDNGNHSNILRPDGILSPGIGVDGSELRTTSGVCIESPSGEKFMTCASHRFPLTALKDAYHPSAAGSKLETVRRQFWDTYDSPLGLAEGIQYSRESCSSSDHDAVSLTSIRNPWMLCAIGDFIYMNSPPFNGHCKGSIIVGVKMLRIPPSDEAEIAPHRYHFGTFAYLGYGSEERPLDRCCRGVAWTEHGEAIGQVRFQSKEWPLVYVHSFV